MSLNQDINILDLHSFEFQLMEKMVELQWKSKALEEAQQELLLIRQDSLNKEVLLEDSKRIISDLRIQLSTANQVIEMIEKEKIKHMNERIQLQINCKAALKERESLLEQTHAAKLENMTLKLNLQKLTETFTANELSKKSLETQLSETQERFSKSYNFLHSNIEKLEKEHQNLRESVKTTAHLNKRLQTVGLCTQAIHTKKNEEIKNLQAQLALNIQSGNVMPSVSYNGTFENSRKDRLDAKAVYQEVCADLEKDREADKEIEAILSG